jgi:hypothetical protein
MEVENAMKKPMDYVTVEEAVGRSFIRDPIHCDLNLARIVIPYIEAINALILFPQWENQYQTYLTL